MSTAICANVECGVEFIKGSHNQIYHDANCCRVVTNRKIMLRYHEKKAKKNRTDRKCKVCNIKLSRYNDGEEDYCLTHQIDRSGMTKNELFGLLGFEYKEQP